MFHPDVEAALQRLQAAPATSEQGQPAAKAANPSWKQLAAIPESITKQAVLHAVGIEPPAKGIADRCEFGAFTFYVGEAGLIVERDGLALYMDGKEALRQFKLSKGTPSGDLARWWLQAKGFLPVAPSA
jgi:hypothetical protein